MRKDKIAIWLNRPTILFFVLISHCLGDSRRHPKQMSYEATDGENWLFVGSNVPVMSESLDEMNPILNCEYEIK